MSGELTIFTAHYDRTSGSPGANDNGAAVFQLLETAINARQRAGNRVVFIFTDGEELSRGESLRNQGSYSLGLYLRENGLGHARIFIFDACGTGDTLIISTAADYILKNETGSGAEAARTKTKALRNAALAAAKKAGLKKVLPLPTPFSEDAGFLRSGMAAQTITALPQKEAAAFGNMIRHGEGAAAALFSCAAGRRDIPETWTVLNGPGDSPRRLTPEHWKLFTAFAGALGDETLL